MDSGFVGPLTTTFTPPSTCLSIITSTTSRPSYSLFIGHWALGDLNCYPSVTSSIDFWSDYVWSPGICPSGYSTACTYDPSAISFDPAATASLCCPSGFTCYGTDWPHVCYSSAETSLTNVWLATGSWPTGGLPDSYSLMTVSPDTVWCDGVPVAWESSDMSPPQGGTTTTTTSQTQGPTYTPSQQGDTATTTTSQTQDLTHTSPSQGGTPTITTSQTQGPTHTTPSKSPVCTSPPAMTSLNIVSSTNLGPLIIMSQNGPSVVYTTAVVTSALPTSNPITHSRLPPYSGQGRPLLSGYCITPEFTLLPGPQSTIVYYVAVIGCIDDKPDCCPFPVATSTVTSTTTVTDLGFPLPVSPTQSTLTICPDDYHTVNSVCCPSGYLLLNATLGGIMPCYISLTTDLVFPPIYVTENLLSTSSTPTVITTTAAIPNMYIAQPYPVNPPSKLSTSAKAGIGAGCGIAVLIITVLLWLLRRYRLADYILRNVNPPADQS